MNRILLFNPERHTAVCLNKINYDHLFVNIADNATFIARLAGCSTSFRLLETKQSYVGETGKLCEGLLLQTRRDRNDRVGVIVQ